jgi:hypothetical protein
MASKKTTSGVQGEGDYIAAKKFQDEERSFVKTGPVERKAREAADALDGPEAEVLETARRISAQGKSMKTAGRPAVHPDQLRDDRDPHTEDNLDKGLEETFPASDPVSTSPGAD